MSDTIAHLTGEVQIQTGNSVGQLMRLLKTIQEIRREASKPITLKVAEKLAPGTHAKAHSQAHLAQTAKQAAKANESVMDAQIKLFAAKLQKAIDGINFDKLKGKAQTAKAKELVAHDKTIAKQQKAFDQATASKAKADKAVAQAQGQHDRNKHATDAAQLRNQAIAQRMAQATQAADQKLDMFQLRRQNNADAQLRAQQLHDARLARLQRLPARQSSNGGYHGNLNPHTGLARFFGVGHGRNHASLHNVAGGLGKIGTTTMGIGGLIEGFAGAFTPAIGALGAFGLAIGATTAVLGALHERIEERQKSTADSEQYRYAAMAASDDPAEQAKVKAGYEKQALDYANPINTDTQKEYTKQYRAMRSRGISSDNAIQYLDNAAAVKRAANVTGIDLTMMDRESRNVLAKGKLTSVQTQAYIGHLGAVSGLFELGAARARGYKGPDEGAAKFLNQHGHFQMTKDDWVAGNAYIANNTRETQQRHASSIEAREIDLENKKFLQRVHQENNPELIAAIHSRLEAEENLNKAMAPLQQSFVAFDAALTRGETALLDMASRLFGLHSDGSKMTSAEQAKTTADAQANAGIYDGGLAPDMLNGQFDPTSAMNADQAKAYNEHIARMDPVNNGWNWLWNRDKYNSDKQAEGFYQAEQFNNTLTLGNNGFDFTDQIKRMSDAAIQSAQAAPNITYTAPAPLQVPGADGSQGQGGVNIAAGAITNTINVDAKGMSPDEVSRAVSRGVQDGSEKVAHQIVNDAQASQKSRYR
ncbi:MULTISPECIES: hypothetical protein [unclassified Pseudomonas]|uniref:hypothetical protein n=1 Tax=unclassified Pseudomonas TaxID=196821 RepID=UPI002249914B|nr:hypothetical protein [Pseudomonas sp. DCB_BG]MCX2708354.1 hypothetical protein [Pseudomonas sp. DCB_BG]